MSTDLTGLPTVRTNSGTTRKNPSCSSKTGDNRSSIGWKPNIHNRTAKPITEQAGTW